MRRYRGLKQVSPPEDQALQDLKALLAERIAQAQSGELVEGSITDIADDALRHASEA